LGQYIINQRLFSVRDSYTIKDTVGNPRFQCKGSIFALRKTFWLNTLTGAPIFKVRQRLCSLLPKFDIFNAQDEKIASVKVKFSLGIKKLAIESETFGDYFIRGGILAWDFAVYQGSDENGPVVARISKKIVSVNDSYSIDIMSGNEAFIMSLCILLDFLYHRDR
jgi:uncharacterized protein YxjI